GAENSFGGVAQAYGDSVPIVVLPAGYPRRLINIPPNFNSFINYQHVTKWAEQVVMADAVPDAMRRAFTQVKNGRPRPVLVEIPVDVMREEVPDGWTYTPAPRLRVAPDPKSVSEVAAALVAAERPVIYAGQGVHYAKAWTEVRDRLKGKPRGRMPAVTAEISRLKTEWMAQWMPRLTAKTTPLSPYRVIYDLLHTVDVPNTIITHDAGSPRDQISPFWEPIAPLTYIGWGKTTQLGYGLGLAMGAKLAQPDKLCVNVWGDAAIGFTGMDFETAVRERIPIRPALLTHLPLAIELKVMATATEKYRSTDISGNYADMAKAFGGWGERVTAPDDIVPAIKRAIAKTREGTPALLEFITEKAVDFSMYPA